MLIRIFARFSIVGGSISVGSEYAASSVGALVKWRKPSFATLRRKSLRESKKSLRRARQWIFLFGWLKLQIPVDEAMCEQFLGVFSQGNQAPVFN